MIFPHALYLHAPCHFTSHLLGRELAQSNLEYATAFGQHGAIEPLVGLLDDPCKPTTLLAAQALACMVACEPCCSQIRYSRLTAHGMSDKHLCVSHSKSAVSGCLHYQCEGTLHCLSSALYRCTMNKVPQIAKALGVAKLLGPIALQLSAMHRHLTPKPGQATLLGPRSRVLLTTVARKQRQPAVW